METIVQHAQGLVYSLLCLMPSEYQKASLKALMGLFLEARGQPLSHQTQIKSASSLSRFLNHYLWSTRAVIRTTRPLFSRREKNNVKMFSLLNKLSESSCSKGLEILMPRGYSSPISFAKAAKGVLQTAWPIFGLFENENTILQA